MPLDLIDADPLATFKRLFEDFSTTDIVLLGEFLRDPVGKTTRGFMHLPRAEMMLDNLGIFIIHMARLASTT